MKVPVPDLDLGKRPRDDFTDKLIKEALEEEQLAKKAKKAGPQPHRKGKTLAEVEQEEGGPVKTSLKAMAHVKRAAQRKAKPMAGDETALVDDAEAEEEEGPDQETLRDLIGDAPLPSASTAAAAAAAGPDRQRHQKPSSMDIDTGGADADGMLAAAAAEGGELTHPEEDDESEAAQRDLAELKEEGAGPAAGTYGVTAFNMTEERQEGEFDAEGNWVFKKPEDADDTDAWLASGEAQPVSDKVRAMAEARAAAMAAAEEAPVLGEAAVAGAQRQLAELLQPGESVAGALRRLGAAAKKRPLTKRDKLKQEEEDAAANGSAPPTAAAGEGAAPDAAAAAAQLARVTELADLLLSAGGELDVYSHRKEQLERWAAAVLPAAPLPDAGDDDMFASDEEAKPAAAGGAKASAAPRAAAGPSQAAPNSSSSQPAHTGAQQQQAPTAAAAAAGPGPSSGPGGTAGAAGGAGSSSSGVDYGSWPIKELRRFCQERGVDPSGIVEKQELVSTVARLAAAGPQGESAALPPASSTPPAGYTWDAAAGYFHSSATGLYWDAATGGYYNPADSKWYAWDAAAAQYVPWT